jgi:hypothetical protein
VLRSAWVLGVGSLLTLGYAGRVLLGAFFGSRGALFQSCDSVARGWSQAVLKLAGVSVQVGEPISVEGMRHSDRDGFRDTVRGAVAQLRGGVGRTSRLPGEPPLDDVSEPLRSSSNPS